MTASKPEMESGDNGRDGSQTIWSLPVAEFRTKRVTAAPPALREGTRTAPIGPEAPLTSMRAEFMVAGSVSTLADWVRVARAPPPAAFDLSAAFNAQSHGRGRPRHTTRPHEQL